MFALKLACVVVFLSLAEALLKPRSEAPDFKAKAVLDDKFIDVSLSKYTQANKWVILLFYPFDFTFICPTEIISFSEHANEFVGLDTQVLAISTDSHHTHLAWSRTKRADGGVGKLSIPLVADTSKMISANYGVLVTEEDDDMFGAALRGLFIIDPSGTVRSVQVNDDSVGRNVDETLRILKAFQWADSHEGEGCPASWTPGADTITANPDGSKAYFSTHYGSA